MTAIKIRKLQRRDISNGFLLSLDSLRKSSHIKPKKASMIFNKISKNPHQVIYVAEENSKIIGSASILIEQKFIHDGGKVGHIEDVVVTKEFQGKGIGKKIVDALLKYAEKQGCYKTILDCTDELIPFYENIGFKRHSNSMRFDHLSKK
ncbi:Acetyltransferase, GNAT family [Nitrosotalea devaniterrae]|uniref:glucosamine-phosphate N-acetyltransferase n=1 Tax=Nitrosotalea devaniterrae TaxID=1078905 RepID=A0A128A1T7_9ARCH|nr:Acetyltransferase, GNAT family [Candidatus Nitrosotalea devanaterra]